MSTILSLRRALGEPKIKNGVRVVRVQHDCALVDFRRRVKALFQPVQILCLFSLLKLHIAQVVIRRLLQFQIRRQRDLLEKILREVKIRRAIRRVARVEYQSQIVRLHFRQPLILLQRICEVWKFSDVVFAQRIRR